MHLTAEVANRGHVVKIAHNVILCRNLRTCTEFLQRQHDAAVPGGQSSVVHARRLQNVKSENTEWVVGRMGYLKNTFRKI